MTFSLLCDGSTNHSMTEQEVVSIAYCNPKIFESCSKYSHLGSPKDSQDAPGLKQCIFDTFKEDKVGDLIPKIKFLSSDGASVNSGKHSGLIRLIQEEFPWVSFIWCFSHCLELALKDSLKSFIDPVDESLLHLFYLYKNSSKKVRELKNLYQILREQFETYGKNIRPVKSTGTRWIDHRIQAMEKLVNKFGLYMQHIQNIIADTTK